MQSLILAGGLGTRLRPVLGETPKPMAPLAGRPFLEYLLLQLRRDGLRQVVLLTGSGSAAVRQYFRDGRDWGISIAYSDESEPLGTGGAVRHALPLLEGTRFLVMNGDSFFDISMLDLIAAHESRKGAEPAATLALARLDHTERFGSVEVDAAGHVTAFREKAANQGAGLINAGIYVVERSVVEAVPNGRAVSLERDVFPGLVGHGLRGAELTGSFVDIGVPDAYQGLRTDPAAILALA